MKRIKLIAIATLFTIASCQKDQSHDIANSAQATHQGGGGSGKNLGSLMRMTEGPFSQYIPLDTANKMINSYLTSINYPANDSSLQSLIFNADSLRNYLNDTSHGKVVQVKLIFAHTAAYINAGNYGVNTNYVSGNLTLIVAGYDHNNNYVYYHPNMVLEHAQPCPYTCVSSGTASSPLLY